MPHVSIFVLPSDLEEAERIAGEMNRRDNLGVTGAHVLSVAVSGGMKTQSHVWTNTDNPRARYADTRLELSRQAAISWMRECSQKGWKMDRMKAGKG